MILSQQNVYRHSGRCGSAPLFVPLVGLPVTLLASVVYAYIDVYSPVVGVITLIVLGLFSVAIGGTVSYVGYKTHCRSPVFLGMMGFLLGLVGLYTSWAAFEYALLQRFDENFNAGFFDILMRPDAVFEIAVAIAKQGWFEALGMTPSGFFLWAMWGIEAVAIVGLSTLIATRSIDDKVYCEQCGRWTARSALELGDPPDRSLITTLRPDHLEPLLELEPASGSGPRRFARIDMWECPTCDTTTAIQINRCAVTKNSEGKLEEHREVLTPIQVVERSMLDGVRLLGQQPESTPPSDESSRTSEDTAPLPDAEEDA